MDLSVGSSALTQAAADFNGDGDADLAVGVIDMNDTDLYGYWPGVSVFYSITQPTVQESQVLLHGGVGTPTAIVAGDFTGDGKPDLAVAELEFGAVTVLQPLGPGYGFTVGQPCDAGSNPVTIAAGDFDGDGKLDVAVGGDDLRVLLGNGDGTFRAAGSYAVTVGSVSTAIAVGDLDGDGNSDLAVADRDPVSVLLGNGDGTFRPRVDYAAGATPVSVAIGDFDRDGKPDLAVADAGGDSVSVLRGSGDGTFGSAIAHAVGTAPNSVAIGDFNADGKPDLVVSNGGGDPALENGSTSVLLGRGDGTFQASTFGAGPWQRSVIVADVNGDGRDDLSVLKNSTVTFWRGNGTPFFQPAVYVTNGVEGKTVGAGDFNGDGKPDAFSISSEDRIAVVALGNGDGTFQSLLYSDASQLFQPERVVLGDFDGDGKLDVAVEYPGYFAMEVLLGNGDGTFRTLPYAADFNEMHVGGLASADVNGDGKLDLAATAIRGDGFLALLGNGDGTFQDPVPYVLSPLLFSIFGDFDGDGTEDLVSPDDRRVAIQLGNGDGTFQSPSFDPLNGDMNSPTRIVSIVPHPDLTNVAVADFDGDGRSDVLMATGGILFGIPPHMALSRSSIAEHQPAGAVVGALSTASDDPDNFFTYELVGGTGGADDASFTIDADGNLLTAASFDADTKSSYSIRVRGTDSLGVAAEQIFTIGVTDVNKPPTVARDLAAVTVDEGSTAANAGTFGDPDGDGAVTLTASLGTVTRDDAAGTWSWSYTPADGPDGPTAVTVTATDGGGLTATTTFTLTVRNAAPTAGVSGPSGGVAGQLRSFTLTASDPSSADQAAGFNFVVDWGDGGPVESVCPGVASGTTAGHAYSASGSYTVAVTATDKDGLAGPSATTSVEIAAIELQGGRLAVGGTTGDDAIQVKSVGGGMLVVLNGVNYGRYAGVTSVALYGRDGDDILEVKAKLPALLDGGAGDDTLKGAAGNNVLLGGAGVDRLFGDAGRDLLIGGLGADLLRGGRGDDILIGGTTDFDADQTALDAIMAEWTRTGSGSRYDARIGHLRDGTAGGLNGPYRLNVTTVHDDAAIDELWGENDDDWFLALTSGLFADLVKDKKGNNLVTPI